MTSRIRYDNQNRLHEQLSGFVTSGRFSRLDLPFALMPGNLARRRHEARLRDELLAFRDSKEASTTGEAVRIACPPFTGDHATVRALATGLEPLRDRLVAAVVHGSVATDEAIAYSDLDALVILRDRVLDRAGLLADTALRLERLQRQMFAFDPLQHHGWFVLMEADLSEYCEAYLPVATLSRAKSLLPQTVGLTLSLRPGMHEARSSFERLAANVIRQATQAPPGNLYQIKSFLSQLMLLPALYLQARDGVGGSKQESFERARPDFSDHVWRVVDEASAIRRDWQVPVKALYPWLQAVLPALRHHIARRFAPGPSPRLLQRLSSSFYADAARLASTMVRQLEGRSPDSRTERGRLFKGAT